MFVAFDGRGAIGSAGAYLLCAHVSGGTGTFFLFGALKTLADVVMHTVEHHVLNKGKSIRASIG